jgi:hypothetical protein
MEVEDVYKQAYELSIGSDSLAQEMEAKGAKGRKG